METYCSYFITCVAVGKKTTRDLTQVQAPVEILYTSNNDGSILTDWNISALVLSYYT